MKNVKRILSVVLCLLMIIGTLSTGVEGFGSIFAVKANGAYTEKLKENADGSFRILQLSDIQDNSYLSAKAFATIRLAIRRYNPNLIVLTGDNILHCNGDDVFNKTVDSFVNEFKDASGNTIPFAVTFGNHDYEVNYHDEEQTQRISLKDQYEYYLSKGAVRLKQDGLNTSGVSSASDNSATLWGTGYIDVYTNDGSKVARRVILLNTGSYDNDITNRNKFARAGYNVETGEEESYSNVVSAVNTWTNAVNGTGEKIKCVVYQHIALQEVYLGDSPETSILTKPTVSGSITHACYNNINNSTITENPEGSGRRQYVVSTTNPTLTGAFDEAPKCSYNSTKDMFIALAKDNVIGLFYGHDHGNTVSAETKITYNGTQYTLTQGFGGGIDVYDGNYNGVDPQGSCYVIDKDGDLIKEAFSYTGLLTDDITYPSGDTKIKYIKEVALFNGSSFENACEEARNAGYIPVTKAFAERSCYADLNSNNCCSSKFVGNGSHYECIAYKQTTNPNEAITDLRIFVTTDETYSRNNQTKTYTLNGKESEYSIVSGCDGNVNYGVTSDTTRAFLYYSKNINAGAPLTDLIVEVGTGSSTDAYRTMDHRALQIGNFVETFGTNDVSSFSNVRIANCNLGANRDTVIGDSVYLFLKRYDGCSGYNTDVPEGIVSEASDPYDEDTKTLIENNGGYIYGVCQPSNNYDALSDIGFNWVRFDIPCPFSADGYNNGDIKYVKSSYEKYKEKCRQYKAKGFKILAVTPYPYDYQNDMGLDPMANTDVVEDIAIYLYNDLKDLVDIFQITNEMNISTFRRSLTPAQAATYIGIQLEAISAEKAKTGDTFPIGYNLGDVTESGLELNGLMAPYLQYCDYVAVDLYTGNQGEASPKDYVKSVKLLNSITHKPIIITEFGFWSEGGPKTAEQKAAILYDNYGYASEAAAIADGQNFIDKLPSQFRKTLQQEHPHEQSQWSSIVFSHYSNHFYGETSQYTINNIPHTPEGQGEYFRQVMTELKNVSCLAGMIIYCCTDHDVCFNCGHSWCPFETKYGIFNYDGTPKASVPAIKETIATLKAIDRLDETTDSVSEKTSVTVYHKNGSKALSCDMGEIYEGSTVTVSPKPIVGYTCTESSTQYTNVSSAVSATYNTYTPVTYTATKNVDGANTTVSFNIDGTALVLNTPQKDGYNFIGWKAVTVAGNSLNKTNFIKNKIYAAGTYKGMYGNVTFEAQWEKLPYTVTFDVSNGGTNLSMASKSVHFGEAYGELATVTAPSGLYFAGWNTKKDGSGSVITSKTICDLTANQTLYACYSDTVYHVAYDNLFIPEEWVSKGGLKYNEVNDYAVYNAEDNSISLTNNRASGEVTTQQNSNYFTIPVTAGTTYSFSVEVKATNATQGWANFQLFVFDSTGYTALCGGGEYVNNNSKKVITSTYTAPAGVTMATIRFGNKTNGSTLTYKNVQFIEKTAADRLDDYISYPSRYDTAVKGAAYDSLTVPTRPGYTFDGWYSDAGLTNKIDENDVVTGNITLYSKWIDINEVTYDNLFSISEYAASNSPKLNEIEGIAPIDLNKGSITVPGNPVSDGGSPYTSWSTDNGYYTIPVTAGTKYYLSFYIDNWGGNVFVKFDNGTATDTDMVKHSGQTYIGDTLSGGQAQKYTFYFKAPSGATKIGLRFGASGTAPRTYSDIKVIDEARYYSDGLYDSAFSYVNANSTYGQLQTPTRSGYSFDGWYTASGTRVTSTSSTGNSNVKLFSHWAKAFDINYNSIFDFDRWGENQVKSGATYSTEVNYGTNSYTITTTSAHTGEVTSTANGGNAYRMPVVGGHKYKISADITADKTNSDSKQYNLLVFEWPETYDVWSGYLSPLSQRNFTLSPGVTQTCSLEFTAKDDADTISLRLALKSDGAGKGTFSNIRIQDMTATPYPEAFVQMNVLKTDSLINQPDKEGYDVNGWYDTVNADGIGGTQYTSPSSFTGNKSLYAKYTQKTFTVTYNSAIGTPQTTKSVAYGANPSTAYTPAAVTGYRFAGWYSDEGLRTFAPLTVTAPLTLYAKWEPLTYNVGYDNIFLLKSQNIANNNVSTVDKNNGTVTMTYQNSEDSSEKNLTTDFIELPSAAGSDTYYIVSADVSATDCRARIMTFFYNESGSACTVAHTNNSSHPVKESDGKAYNGETPIYASNTNARHYYVIKVPEGCKKIKLRFDCLNADVSKKRIAVFSNIRVVEKTVNTYLTATANYSILENTVNFSSAYRLPSILGYTVDGWYTDSACTVPANTTACNTASNHTLYSKCTAVLYNITYNGTEGATFKSEKKETYTIDTATFMLPVLEKAGYNFLGWTDDNETATSMSVSIVKGTTGDKTFTANWSKTDISLGGGMDEQDILESPSVTISSVNGTPISGIGMTKIEGADIDLNINGNGVVSYTLKNMTWSKPETFTITLSTGGTASITIYPQTNILYEESSGTFSASYDEETMPWGWRTVEDNNHKLRVPGTSDSKVYGYSNAYANNNQYSAGYAKQAVVSSKDTGYSTYQFTFTGTGFDIIGMCDNNSGVLLVRIKDSEGNVIETGMINTHHSGGKRYQEVVYHKDNLKYGTYTVTAAAYYNYLFDLTGDVQTAGYNTVVPESGSIVDLSAVFGKEYSHCKYYCIESESYRAGNTDIVDFEPVVVGKGTPYTEQDGDYNVTIDGVRVYNPGDLENYSSLTEKYEADGESNATYEKLVDIFNRIKENVQVSDNSLYIEGGTTGDWTEYQKVGSKSEVQIFADSGQAVAFNVSNYKKLHISFKAVGGVPQGGILSAVVNGNRIDIDSATEQYYDVTDFIDKDGNIAIACVAEGYGEIKPILAICNFKYIAKSSSTQSIENTVIFEATEGALNNARTMLTTIQKPEAEDMTFTVDFGKYGTTQIKVKKEYIKVERVNGVWTATAKLSQETVEELVEKMGITDDYGIDGKGITLTAKRVGDEWQTEQNTVKVKKLNLFEKFVQKLVRFFALVIERITLKFKSSRDI